ncbi:MAG: hypothetical protein Q8P20_00920 [bacterium]|nr:hypothetical protein [bacterium]
MHETTQMVAEKLWDLDNIPSLEQARLILSKIAADYFPILIELLKGKIGRTTLENVSAICKAAEADRQFGNLSSGMADYYDNEVQAEHRGGPSQGDKDQEKFQKLSKLINTIKKERVM